MRARGPLASRSPRVRAYVAALAGLLVVVAGLAVRAATMRDARPAPERFAPAELASLEQRAWQAYYERRWPVLFGLLFRVTRDHFGLSFWRTPYATYLATRAQVAFARQGDRDGEAEAAMRRFYTLVRDDGGGRFDAERVAAAEIRWWVIHRNRADYPDAGALVDALAELYAELYGLRVDAARPAAHHRAEAMELSDRWVREGKDPDSPLLSRIRAELLASYRLLKPALAG